jgi:hypothetical protein
VVRQVLGIFPGDSEADPSIFGFPPQKDAAGARRAESSGEAYEEEQAFAGYEESYQ